MRDGGKKLHTASISIHLHPSPSPGCVSSQYASVEASIGPDSTHRGTNVPVVKKKEKKKKTINLPLTGAR